MIFLFPKVKQDQLWMLYITYGIFPAISVTGHNPNEPSYFEVRTISGLWPQGTLPVSVVNTPHAKPTMLWS